MGGGGTHKEEGEGWGDKKSAPGLCTAVSRIKYPLDREFREDANGVLVHPWTKLRLRRTSCPAIAGYRKGY
ncbi:MAG: hypothetical protein K2N15_07475 [Lachnospiraceae bacterium]|nr:hypothetical protein [Lachnospiraceae bacterium]